ncbi:MAG: peptidylprolyl isomerase [Saprospiraceae bacterium]|nr:peptidylprolyl isomerase [Saprospiraceae bacterium]MDP5000187.1 peptidylprolyl isomerase [Saprospiraceae bacterium]
MALISQIRKNSWILVVMIALGLGGFILMDMTAGQQSLFGGSQFTVGNVEGEKLDWNKFSQVDQVIYGNSGAEVYSRRENLWNFFVEDILISRESEGNGLGIGKPELLDLQFGDNNMQNISPVIQARFGDPMTGMINMQLLSQYKASIQNNTLTDPGIRSFWAQQEKEIIKDRLQTKLTFMVEKGMYTPSWMAEMSNRDLNQRMDFAYVKVPLDELDNTEVSVSDSDFKAYLQENKAVYTIKEERRSIAYVNFPVVPTAADSAAIRGRLAELAAEFESAENDSLFLLNNLGTLDPVFYKKDELGVALADNLFDLPAGSVYGPYREGNAYKIAKLLDKQVLPDSVKSRHILIRASTPVEFESAEKLLDSLTVLIERGVESFDSLAAKFGTDGTAQLGGDLGYVTQGMMVQPFNDLIFQEAVPGKLYQVNTQFGRHLVEVTGRRFIDNEPSVRVGIVSQSIVPSDETQNAAYDKVLAFVGQNRDLAALQAAVDNDPGLSLENVFGLRENDFEVDGLDAGGSSRNIVRWAFGASEGDVSAEIYSFQDPVDFYDNRYVVVALVDVQSSGLPDLAGIRAEIEPLVINKKKAELLAEKIAGMDMAGIASAYNVAVDTAFSVAFSQSFVSGIGSEPKVVATAFSLSNGQTSGAVVGDSGVFKLMMINKTSMDGVDPNIPQIRQQVSALNRGQVYSGLIEGIKRSAKIKDYRFKFY